MASTVANPGFIRLTIGAGQAKAVPPIGPAFGQRGIKAMDFCKDFNSRTGNMVPGTPMQVRVHLKPDRTFTWTLKPPKTSWLLLRAAGVERGDTAAVVGRLTCRHVYEIAKLKQLDPHLTGESLQGIAKMVAAHARQIGLDIVR